MTRIRVSAFALAIGLLAAPQVFAQSRSHVSQVLVCRDGRVTSTRSGDRACNRHGGIGSNGANRSVYGAIDGTNDGRVNRDRDDRDDDERGVKGRDRDDDERGVNGRDRDDDDDRDVKGEDRDDDDRGVSGNGYGNGRGHAYGHSKAKHRKHGSDRD